ncbi:MAG: pirin family protein [Pseudomonadota bacterium]
MNNHITIRKAGDRGHARFDWLDSRHTFSFGHYYDPAHMGFGPLRVINEDWIAPAKGFETHGHRDMEIITYVLDGAVAHKDSLGNGSVIRPGEVQMMSAGRGIRHSEFNDMSDQTTHMLQIWIEPSTKGGEPGYQQEALSADQTPGHWRLLVDPDGTDGALRMKQDARLFAARLSEGEAIEITPAAGRRHWLQIAKGAGGLDEHDLVSGDGVAMSLTTPITLRAGHQGVEALLFDLPA